MARISKPPEQRKEEIILAARELFREKGYEQTTVRDIVQKLGVAQGLFYYYFKNKEEVLFAASQKQGEDFMAEIAHMIASREKPPIQRAREAFHIIAEFFRQMDFGTPASPQLQAYFEQRTRDMLEPYLTELLVEGKRTGDFQVEYPEYTARFIITGFVGLCMEGAAPTAEEKITLVQVLIERILCVPQGALQPMENGDKIQ